MENVLERLPSDLSTYRTAVDRILADPLANLQDFRDCFLDILVSASRLHLDYQLFRKQLPELLEAAEKDRSHFPIKSDLRREAEHRARLREKLEALSCWKYFREGALAASAGLRSPSDFIDRFSLHLPEIYEETIHVEIYAHHFLNTSSDSALAGVEAGMQHLSRNHISFVLQALEWASDESSWREP